MITIQVTSDINPTGLEKRYSKDVILKDLKKKLVLITGVEAENQAIELFVDDILIGTLDNNSQNLADLIGNSNLGRKLRLHVKDILNSNQDLLDEDSVEKYEMSDEAYEKRENSLRNFKKQNKLGRFADPNQ